MLILFPTPFRHVHSFDPKDDVTKVCKALAKTLSLSETSMIFLLMLLGIQSSCSDMDCWHYLG